MSRTIITVRSDGTTSISITVRSVCLEADRTVVSNREMSCFEYQLGISCWTAVTSSFLSLYPDTPMSVLAKQNPCSMWSNWPTCPVMQVKLLKIAIFISAVALSASRSIIYGKKVASNWCELYAARVCAQSCQSLSVIDHHCICVGVCPKLCVCVCVCVCVRPYSSSRLWLPAIKMEALATWGGKKTSVTAAWM